MNTDGSEEKVEILKLDVEGEKEIVGWNVNRESFGRWKAKGKRLKFQQRKS